MTRPLRIFTWPNDSWYLKILAHVPHQFYALAPKERLDFFAPNCHLVASTEVKDLELDCILFQQAEQFLYDQYFLFSTAQRDLPKIYLEHFAPTNLSPSKKHFVNEKHVLVVHSSLKNALSWDAGSSSTRIIEHDIFSVDLDVDRFVREWCDAFAEACRLGGSRNTFTEGSANKFLQEAS